ncbi:MAG: sugar phosphate isomerase/epimerase [Candidatus Nanoarchaeia archaeon]|nr:sugar phosphate isomerase/epimerase [Candidatus Nanoarchaeia archaeon]
MKIGFPNNPRKDLVEEVEWIGKSGFDFVDLFLEEDMAVPEKIKIEKIKKIIKKYNLETVGHTGPYLQTGSPSKAIREASVKDAVRYFPIFQKLGVKYITVHGNWPFSLFSVEDGIKFQVESLTKLVREAKKYNLKIMFEPVGKKQESYEVVAKIITKVPGLHFHLDIGHSNLYGRNPVKYIKELNKELRHVHLHDNNGSEDEHLPIGAGNINWEKTLKVLKKYYDGTITLEIFAKDKEFSLTSKDKLRRMWNKL